jgi:hypothetical protein
MSTVEQAPGGHKTASVFQRYNITAVEDLRDAASKIAAFQISGGK